jgi:GntR family transcriptional regulator, arabinose operon transcriptional repressor
MNIPKYEMIRNYIKHLLIEGSIKLGEKLPSEYELMEKFHVSRHTIRKAFGELQSCGYICKKQGKGTFSNYRHGEKPKQIIAVLSTFISSFVFPSIISGIEQVLSDEGYMMLLSNTNNEKEKEAQFLTNILEHNVAGMIVEPSKSAAGNVNQKLWDEVRRRKIITVFINAVYQGFSSSYVLLDDAKGGMMVAEYLLQLGHQKIASIMKTDDRQGLDRMSGMVSVLRKYGVPVHADYLAEYETHSMFEAPYLLTQTLMRKKDRPTAVFCYNDQCALMAIQAILDSGLSVPEDISVVGFDDSLEMLHSSLKLTTVSHPKKEMGIQAAKFLVGMLNGRLEFPQKVFQPELIVRNSCRRV